MQRKKMKEIRLTLCSVFMGLLMMATGINVHAYTSDDVPGVEFSTDGGAWTVREALPEDADPSSDASYWVQSGTSVDTGIALNIPVVEVGQHEYKYDRKGYIPIYQWECIHRRGKCIHGHEPSNEFHGIIVDNNICGNTYYSGWAPFCADCGEQICVYMHYMSTSKAQSIQYVNVDKDYYYMCPTCDHVEQAVGYNHECRAVSYNQYKVVYIRNNDDASGEMSPSYHMYNNATQLNGMDVEPNRYLSKNVFTRDGYVFIGWSLTPGANSEEQVDFLDEQEIYNLTAEYYDPENDPTKGIVTLYAVWRVLMRLLR